MAGEQWRTHSASGKAEYRALYVREEDLHPGERLGPEPVALERLSGRRVRARVGVRLVGPRLVDLERAAPLGSRALVDHSSRLAEQ